MTNNKLTKISKQHATQMYNIVLEKINEEYKKIRPWMKKLYLGGKNYPAQQEEKW